MRRTAVCVVCVCVYIYSIGGGGGAADTPSGFAQHPTPLPCHLHENDPGLTALLRLHHTPTATAAANIYTNNNKPSLLRFVQLFIRIRTPPLSTATAARTKRGTDYYTRIRVWLHQAFKHNFTQITLFKI